jgi:predicted Zn finger-like uncharacterized protein
MATSTQCPRCAARLAVNAEWQGKQVRCPACGETFLARPQRQEEDADDRRPRRRSADSSSGLRVIGLCLGGALLLSAGIVTTILLLVGDAEPEPVARGPAPPRGIVAPQPIRLLQIPKQPLPLPPDVAPNADPITRAVAGLRSEGVHWQGDGVQLLQRTPADPMRREEVLQALKAIIDKRQPFSPRSGATRTLGTWGTRADVPYVLRLLDDDERGVQQGAIEVLGKLKDARAADVLAQKMREGFERALAAQALKEIGPGAEAAVCRLLDEKDNGLRIDACHILRVIGTKASHPALLRLTREQEQDVANAAREALPEKERPAVWGRALILTLNVHLTPAHPWPQLEAKLKALTDDPAPICRTRQSGDYMWVELSPVRCDAQTFARRVNFARVVAVHNDQRLIYLDPGR